MHAADLASRLGARHVGDHWLTRCPAHDDRHPSLDFRDGALGVVVYCRSRGCRLEDICRGWGIRPVELFFDRQAGPIAQAVLRESQQPKQPAWWRDPRLAALWMGVQETVHGLDRLARQARDHAQACGETEAGFDWAEMQAALEREADRLATCVAPADLVADRHHG